MNFPDLPHLLQLQRDLWKWPRSRAALMVGAGFSRNADPLAGVTSRFPTWRQLVRAMFEELHPASPDDTVEARTSREEKFNSASPLRIASEFEAALGRDKLDNLIREQNPDSDFAPSTLHQLLMGLPWVDVFTTNYDTLLERTDVPGRNYQVVTRPEELPSSVAPRIVKLHGSFPSHSTFVISEEDYRTYPRRSAPFVNTVQQALLENAFVLVGFSGDDPNFLAWTGWIRDELGEHHAPIYLVGPLGLGNAERQLLHKRGVTPIDLAPLFQGTPPDKLHRKSMEWFLKCLAAARPPRPDRWPEFADTAVTLAENMPPIVGAAERAPNEIPLAPNPQGPTTNETISSLIQRWRFERLHYPGWVVLPHQKRTPLWNATEYWIDALFRLSESWPVAERLVLYREINWRLETAMVPLFADMMVPLEKAAQEGSLLLTQGNIPCLSNILPSLAANDTDVVSAWLEIMFGLLREARETYNEGRWKALKADIDKVVHNQPEFEDQNKYEEALWSMWNVKREEAKNIIAQWRPSAGSPLACLRKAGLLAELDELGEARTVLRSALSNVRKALRIHGQNINLLSLEGWVTYLIFGVEQALTWQSRTPVREEFWERWQELKAWDCSPWVQIEYFEQELSNDPPKIEPMEKENRGFDPGESSISVTYKGYLPAFFPAFACLRFYEQAGIPLRLHRVSLMGKTLLNACNWIAPFIGFWSPAILLRAGNADELAKNSLFMTRSGVALLPLEIAQRLHTWFLNILEKELIAIGNAISYDSAQESILKNLPEVISRLTTRASEAELRRSFSVAFKLHNLLAVRTHLSMHDVCEPWFKRIFVSAEPALLLEWLPLLIKSPLFDGVQQPEWRPPDANWPDPMDHFPSERVAKVLHSNPEVVTKVNDATSWLLNRAASETGVAWRRAVLRLLNLSSWGLLDEIQARQARALAWSKLNKHGLPDLTNLRALSYVIRLDQPNESTSHAEVKKYILSLQLHSATKEHNATRVLAVTPEWRQLLFHEVIVASKQQVSFRGEPLTGIEWTADEANFLFEQALKWWETDKAVVQSADQRKGKSFFSGNAVLNQARYLDDYLRLAVLPYLDWPDPVKWDRLFNWLNELRSVEVYVDAALPYILLKHPERANEFRSQIVQDVDSNNEEAVVAGAEATRFWAHLAKSGKIEGLGPGPIDVFVKRVALRRDERVEYCLSIFSHLMDEIPDLFSSGQVDFLAASLGPWDKSTALTTLANTPDGFPPARRPVLRTRIGELAGALKRWHLKVEPSVPIPKEITEWESMCNSDALPEIRRSFNC